MLKKGLVSNNFLLDGVSCTNWAVLFLLILGITEAFAQTGGYGQQSVVDSPVGSYLKWASKNIEILGFTYCGGYLLGSLAALLQKRWIVSVLLFLLMPVSFFCGALTKFLYGGLVSFTMNSQWAGLALLFCIIHSLISFLWFIAIGFLPTIVAYKREHKDFKLLFKLNFLAAIPLVWPILLYLAYGETEEN